MKDLRALLTGLGHQGAQTYIQSGNCVFKSTMTVAEDISNEISTAIEEQFGFRPQTLALPLASLQEALAQNPYPEATAAPKNLHLLFLMSAVDTGDLDQLRALCRPTEQITLGGDVLYFYAPDGIGRSVAAARAQQTLKTQATARNLRTVMKLVELATSIQTTR